jgi:hypothetical protein
MRSAEQARVSTIRHTDSHLLLMRVVMAIVSTLALLFVWHPVVLRAQEAPPAAGEHQTPSRPKAAAKPAPASDTASTTHVVKASETLGASRRVITVMATSGGPSLAATASRFSADTALRIGTKLVIPSKKTVVAAASVASTLPGSRRHR